MSARAAELTLALGSHSPDCVLPSDCVLLSASDTHHSLESPEPGTQAYLLGTP